MVIYIIDNAPYNYTSLPFP